MIPVTRYEAKRDMTFEPRGIEIREMRSWPFLSQRQWTQRDLFHKDGRQKTFLLLITKLSVFFSQAVDRYWKNMKQIFDFDQLLRK